MMGAVNGTGNANPSGVPDICWEFVLYVLLYNYCFSSG